MDILGRLGGRGDHTYQDDIDEEGLYPLVGDEHGCDTPFIAVHKGSRRDISTRRKKSGNHYASNTKEENFDRLCMEVVGISSGKGSKADSGKKKRSRGGEGTSNVFDHVISRLEENVRATMQGEDEHVFGEVDELAKHCLKRHTRGYDHVIPTGLVFGGGVNSADHSRLFPAIKEYLEGKQCRVALLSPNAFTGKTVGFTLRKIIDQLKKDDSEVDQVAFEEDYFDMDDMVEWYKTHVASEGEIQPIIIIVESVETTQSGMLQDLIHLLHEAYPFLPHILLLGLTTASETLADALPHSMVDRYLCCFKFAMASSVLQLEAFTDMMLLGPWNGCIIDPITFNDLLDTFLLHHFTVSAMFSGLKLALSELFSTHPCLSIVEKSFGSKFEFKNHLETLSPQVLDSLLDFIGAENESSQNSTRRKQESGQQRTTYIYDAYCTFREKWEIWRFAFRLFTSSGKAMDPSPTYSAWKTFEKHATLEFSKTILPSLIADFNKHIQELNEVKLLGLHQEVNRIYEMEYKDSEWLPESGKKLIEDLNRLVEGWKQANIQSGEKSKQNIQSRPSKETDMVVQDEAVKATSGKGKASRRKAIMSLSTCPVNESDGKEIHVDSFSSEWSKILCSFILRELDSHPWSQPGAKLFACRLEPVEDNLIASTRENIHRALTQPKLFYHSNGNKNSSHVRESLGIDGSDEDTCIAYSLLEQDASCSNLVDWYTSFESVVPAIPTSSSGLSDNDVRVQKIARFSQSLQDLQYIGMIQSSRRKKGDHAQRCIFQPEVNIS